MAKIADEYIVVDPWKIIERGWNTQRNATSESLFSLGNEYMGVRGYFDEGMSNSNALEVQSAPISLRGSYFNGIYEEAKTEGTSYKGIVQKTHFMVNAVDWLYTKIYADGQLIQLNPRDDSGRVIDFERILDLRTGVLTRNFSFITNNNKTLNLKFKRFLDMNDEHKAFQYISAACSDASIDLIIETGCDFSIIQESSQKKYWNTLRYDSNDRFGAILAETKTTRQKVFSGFSCITSPSDAEEYVVGENTCIRRFKVHLTPGESFFIEKSIHNYADKTGDLSEAEIWGNGIDALIDQKETLQCAQKRQEEYWSGVWERSDIRIFGDDKNQQGIRFCIFQMNQTYKGLDSSNNIGAKGLTGEAYNGHAFWDTETYCLPFYLYSNPAAAKNLLEFRYNTLDQAKERAKMLDSKGACYPVASLNGEEACNLWQHASLQFQPSTGVAYGIAHYYTVTQDSDFLYSHGIEMLIEISRFLVSRGEWNNERNGFGFYAVMGPDEFHMMVNNNVYTNCMAKKTLEYTLGVIAQIKQNEEAYIDLINRTKLTDDEVNNFANCAEKMIILFDENTQLYEQHEGFFSLPHKDIDSIPVSDFPLYHHWSYDRIYRYDMIKQPDVLMYMFLYRGIFSKQVVSANYDYYEPRTIHESSLSPSVHSILALDIGRIDEALNFFGFATRLDIDNYNRNTHEGLHITSIAAAWLNIVFGFGGLQSDPENTDGLVLSPSLPKNWQGYEFRLIFQNMPLLVKVTDKSVEISLLNQILKADLCIKLYGKTYKLQGNQLIVPLKKD